MAEKKRPKENMATTTTGKKTPPEKEFWIEEASANSPIYNRSYAICEKRSTDAFTRIIKKIIRDDANAHV